MNKENKKIQIGIDGPAGSGKSTIAKLLANTLNITYINTGGIFRCYAIFLKEHDYKDEKILKEVLPNINVQIKNNIFLLNNKNVTDEILDIEIGDLASDISKNEIVRKKYHDDIKKIINENDVVMEGRDITTVIIPNAKFKFYLTADIDTRAKRRWEQSKRTKSLEEIKKQIINRDLNDTNRKIAPLKIATDAIVIDSSKLDIQEVIDKMVSIINK